MALLSIVVIPVTVEIFEKLLGMPLQTPIRSIAELVVRTVLAPVLIGIMVRRLVPSLADRIAKPLGGLAFALLVLALLPVLFAAARTMVSLIGNGTILALAAFALVGLFVGYRFAGPAPHKKHVLALATSSRHPGVAVAIANANFPNQKLVIPAIFLYLIVSGILIGIFSNRSKAGQIPGESEMRPAA
jgi:BASS family bile acid:Na+ symporter